MRRYPHLPTTTVPDASNFALGTSRPTLRPSTDLEGPREQYTAAGTQVVSQHAKSAERAMDHMDP